MKAAEVISQTLGGKELVYGRKGLAPRHKEIGIHAVRGGDIVGDHTVLFAGDGERIEIKHQAHSRSAFAKGAVQRDGSQKSSRAYMKCRMSWVLNKL